MGFNSRISTMSTKMPRLLLLHLLLPTLILLPFASCTNNIWSFCNQDKIIPKRSSIQSNIKLVLDELLGSVSPSGFAQAAHGQETVFGLLQCRGDVSAEECAACSTDAVKQISQLCPNSSDARIWFDYCFLRYDTANFFEKLDTDYTFAFVNTKSVNDRIAFAEKLGGVMKKAREEALIPGNKALGRGETEFSPLITIYGMTQCTRDLPALSCAKCLSIAISGFTTCCDGSEGGQVHFSSCFARFEIYPFFYPVDSVPGKRELRPFNVFNRNSSRVVYYPYHP